MNTYEELRIAEAMHGECACRMHRALSFRRVPVTAGAPPSEPVVTPRDARSLLS
jgi:hypothetical protein